MPLGKMKRFKSNWNWMDELTIHVFILTIWSPWKARVVVAQVVRKLPVVGPTRSLQWSKDPAIGPYPEPGETSLQSLSCFHKIHLNIILLSVPRSSKKSFPSGFLTKLLYIFMSSAMCATCTTHLTPLD